MKLKVIQFIALLLLLLVTGVFWGPWLALHRSIEVFSAAELIHIVKTIAQNLAGPMRILMPSCIVFLFLSAWFYTQKKSLGFYFNIASLVLIVIAFLITIMVEVPIVNQIKEWNTSAVPADWESIRNHWVFFHVIRTFAALVGFCFFSALVLIPFKK